MTGTPPMTGYKQRDVVLVNFIFSEGTGFKKRPALILSSEHYHRNRREIIIAAITSNVQRILTGDTTIKDWKKANLLFPSLVTGILQTIKSNMIDRILGTLSNEDFLNAQQNLKIALVPRLT